MGRGNKKITRIVFCGNKPQCPDCPLMGNFTQIKLHLKATHKITDVELIRNKGGKICYMCGLEFSNVKEISKHMLTYH